ncbi:RNA polymerase sigma factor [Mucilaginibacter sp.]|uniref:RNA polymerase sigma factor n=1 Tax=Mucilaginibacter sp. TaxID=1882438 RepID=UPI003D0BF6A9
MHLDLYQMLLNNDEAAYSMIYKAHYAIIKQYILKNNGSEDDVKDLFQEGIIALWDNIQSEKYAHTNDSMLHGYFRTICKYKWMEIIRNRSKTVIIQADENLDLQSDELVLNSMIKREEIQAFTDVFAGLSDKCRQILSLFYYDKKTMKQISVITGYEISSMRNEKYKCIEKLRQLYFNKQPKK